jgi:hypothetical protein
MRDENTGTTQLRRDLPIVYRYVTEWAQWHWQCLDCDQTGLRSDSRYNMRDTQAVAMRHNCR